MKPRSKPAYRRRRVVRRKGKRFAGRKSGSISPLTGNIATVVETYDGGQIIANRPYEIREVLANFSRASLVAQQYQFYRLTKIKLEFQPRHNLFNYNNNTTITQSVPQFYRIMNRNGSLPIIFDLEYMLSQGVNPRKFTSDIEIYFKPNLLGLVGVVDNNQGIASQNTDLNFDRWLSTYRQGTDLGGNPVPPSFNDATDYYGMGFFFYQQDEGGASPNNIAQIKITGVWEFKQPCTIVNPPREGQSLTSTVKKVGVADK